MKYNLKSGKYYIGDPCYLFDKEWNNICDFMINGHMNQGEYISPKGYFVIYGSTAYGDGVYIDNNHGEYAVDSGVLGIVPFDAIFIDNILDLNSDFDMYSIVEFKEPFIVHVDGNGFFNFGDIFIDTKDIYDQEEDYPYDEEDD